MKRITNFSIVEHAIVGAISGVQETLEKTTSIEERIELNNSLSNLVQTFTNFYKTIDNKNIVYLIYLHKKYQELASSDEIPDMTDEDELFRKFAAFLEKENLL